MRKILLFACVLLVLPLAQSQTLLVPDTVSIQETVARLLYDYQSTTNRIVQIQHDLTALQQKNEVDKSKLGTVGNQINTLTQSVDTIAQHLLTMDKDLTAFRYAVDSIGKSITVPNNKTRETGPSALPWLAALAGLLTLLAIMYVGFRKLQQMLHQVKADALSTERPQTDPTLTQMSDKMRQLGYDLGKVQETVNSLVLSMPSLPQQEKALTRLMDQMDTLMDDNRKLKEKLDTILASSSKSKKQPDMVAYNAAVDAWIHINGHLSSLGKDRWRIQHVYKYLAGLDVSKEELQADLQNLTPERKEEVVTIIDDIRRFMGVHKRAIDDWLADSSHPSGIKSFQEAVRMPLGQPYDAEKDEELTGDSVETGVKITNVASLGYYFPEARNGGFLQKSKVLVED